MVYVTGDLHGEYARFSDPAFRRLKKGDTLIVCGDFGFLWKGGKKEEALLRKIGKKRYTVLFLDGRHENFELLNAYPVTDWNGGKAQVVSGNLIHLLRGELYTLEGESYFTFGGGESPDRELRAAAGAWWEEEMPSPAEMRHGLETLMQAGKKVDYILTHEPSGKCRGLLESRGPGWTVSTSISTSSKSTWNTAGGFSAASIWTRPSPAATVRCSVTWFRSGRRRNGHDLPDEWRGGTPGRLTAR